MRLVRSISLILSKASILHIASTNAQDWGDWYDSYKLDYSYDTTSSNGPIAWGTVDGIGEWAGYADTATLISAAGGNQCNTRSRPSPIHLDERSSTQQQFYCPDLHEPLPRQINPETDCGRWDVTFAITPYGLKAYFPLSDGYCRRPSLIFSGLYDPYVLLWMEVHARSEHVIAGRRYDAEIQMVHAGTGSEVGLLMTVSLLVDASAPEDDLEFEWMLRQWKDSEKNEKSYCDEGRRGRQSRQRDLSDYLQHGHLSSYINDNSTTISSEARKLQFTASPCRTDQFGRGCEPLGPRRRMFPYNLWQSIWYYGYSGSMTAPPCSEIVQWRVLDEPLRISRRQYKVLTSLLTQSRDDECEFDTAVDYNGENRRPIQESFNSVFHGVYHCTPVDFGYFVYSSDEQ